MNNEDRDQLTDRLLDAALARYSAAEPRNGLEQRILANLAAQNTKRPTIWNRVLWACTACAAAVALVIGLSLLHQTKRPANPPAATTSASAHVQPQPTQFTASKAAPVQTTRKPRVRTTAVVAKQVASPRQSHFPALTGPTEQELLLMAYLNATPTHELLAVAADQQQWRERAKDNSQSTDRTSVPAPEVNDLRNPPLESGTNTSSASSAR